MCHTPYSYTTADKILSLLSKLTFQMSEDGLLTIANNTPTFAEVEPFVFRQTDGSRTLIFRCDGQSPATHAFFSDSPVVARERMPASANLSLHLTILGLGLVLFLSFLAGGLIGFWVRHKRSQDAHPQLAQVARWVLAVAAGLSLLFLLLSALLFINRVTGAIPLYGLSPVLFVLMIAAALAASGFTFLVWKHSYWNLFGRVHYTAVVLTTWAFVGSMQYWHLMRW